MWQDNYIELMPGESREITAQFLSPDSLGRLARSSALPGGTSNRRRFALSEEIGRQAVTNGETVGTEIC